MTNPVWLVFVLMATLLWSTTSLLYKAGARDGNESHICLKYSVCVGMEYAIFALGCWIYLYWKEGKVYNPFNIGAYGGTDPLYNGLVYAKAAGWNTPEKALNGGAKLLAKYYINKGQHTTYYQRFNARNGASKMGTHQYMTNIQAPYYEALSTKNSYASYGITSHSLVFEIPIYNSMPGSTKLP